VRIFGFNAPLGTELKKFLVPLTPQALAMAYWQVYKIQMY